MINTTALVSKQWMLKPFLALALIHEYLIGSTLLFWANLQFWNAEYVLNDKMCGQGSQVG